MFFNKLRAAYVPGGISFTDGFLDGYHSLVPFRDPATIPFRAASLGSNSIPMWISTGPRAGSVGQGQRY